MWPAPRSTLTRASLVKPSYCRKLRRAADGAIRFTGSASCWTALPGSVSVNQAGSPGFFGQIGNLAAGTPHPYGNALKGGARLLEHAATVHSRVNFRRPVRGSGYYRRRRCYCRLRSATQTGHPRREPGLGVLHGVHQRFGVPGGCSPSTGIITMRIEPCFHTPATAPDHPPPWLCLAQLLHWPSKALGYRMLTESDNRP